MRYEAGGQAKHGGDAVGVGWREHEYAGKDRREVQSTGQAFSRLRFEAQVYSTITDVEGRFAARPLNN